MNRQWSTARKRNAVNLACDKVNGLQRLKFGYKYKQYAEVCAYVITITGLHNVNSRINV